MRVNQDSRTIKKGEWFVAVKGEKFDGHKFIPEALRKGAEGILEIDELYDLARKKLAEVKPEVIAVTGSYGKTTTKEAIAKVLGSRFKVLKTSGNLNTPLGVAMGIVNELKPSHQVLVAEVGMDHLGEIRQTCSIIKPQVGVVTAVGEMHLEKLGTLANIRAAKAELLESLPAGGVAVLNADDSNVRRISEVFSGVKVWYGFSKAADVRPANYPGLRLKLLGRANLANALAAAAVGKVFGIPREKILPALSQLRPKRGRLFLIRVKGGVRVIDDTYNAGPRSMAEALRVLGELPAKRRIAILGDMLELGRIEPRAHLEVAVQAVKAADIFVPIGKQMGRAAKKLGVGVPIESLQLQSGDVVLVKGSRGMGMERIVGKIRLGRCFAL